jgi:multimeric flavodoxin WrbA
MSAKVIGVTGSPRANGNTDFAVNTALQALERECGATTELLAVRDYSLEHCAGCRGCMTAKRCVIEGDDLERMVKPLNEADVIIVGSPVYWNSPPGVMKDFMDRVHGWFVVGPIWEGKQAGIINVAADGGFDSHEDALRGWLSYYGANIVATARLLAREAGDLEANAREREKLDQFARAMAEAIR